MPRWVWIHEDGDTGVQYFQDPINGKIIGVPGETVAKGNALLSVDDKGGAVFEKAGKKMGNPSVEKTEKWLEEKGHWYDMSTRPGGGRARPTLPGFEPHAAEGMPKNFEEGLKEVNPIMRSTAGALMKLKGSANSLMARARGDVEGFDDWKARKLRKDLSDPPEGTTPEDRAELRRQWKVLTGLDWVDKRDLVLANEDPKIMRALQLQGGDVIRGRQNAREVFSGLNAAAGEWVDKRVESRERSAAGEATSDDYFRLATGMTPEGWGELGGAFVGAVPHAVATLAEAVSGEPERIRSRPVEAALEAAPVVAPVVSRAVKGVMQTGTPEVRAAIRSVRGADAEVQAAEAANRARSAAPSAPTPTAPPPPAAPTAAPAGAMPPQAPAEFQRIGNRLRVLEETPPPPPPPRPAPPVRQPGTPLNVVEDLSLENLRARLTPDDLASMNPVVGEPLAMTPAASEYSAKLAQKYLRESSKGTPSLISEELSSPQTPRAKARRLAEPSPSDEAAAMESLAARMEHGPAMATGVREALGEPNTGQFAVAMRRMVARGESGLKPASPLAPRSLPDPRALGFPVAPEAEIGVTPKRWVTGKPPKNAIPGSELPSRAVIGGASERGYSILDEAAAPKPPPPPPPRVPPPVPPEPAPAPKWSESVAPEELDLARKLTGKDSVFDDLVKAADAGDELAQADLAVRAIRGRALEKYASEVAVDNIEQYARGFSVAPSGLIDDSLRFGGALNKFSGISPVKVAKLPGSGPFARRYVKVEGNLARSLPQLAGKWIPKRDVYALSTSLAERDPSGLWGKLSSAIKATVTSQSPFGQAKAWVGDALNQVAHGGMPHDIITAVRKVTGGGTAGTKHTVALFSRSMLPYGKGHLFDALKSRESLVDLGLSLKEGRVKFRPRKIDAPYYATVRESFRKAGADSATIEALVNGADRIMRGENAINYNASKAYEVRDIANRYGIFERALERELGKGTLRPVRLSKMTPDQIDKIVAARPEALKTAFFESLNWGFDYTEVPRIASVAGQTMTVPFARYFAASSKVAAEAVAKHRFALGAMREVVRDHIYDNPSEEELLRRVYADSRSWARIPLPWGGTVQATAYLPYAMPGLEDVGEMLIGSLEEGNYSPSMVANPFMILAAGQDMYGNKIDDDPETAGWGEKIMGTNMAKRFANLFITGGVTPAWATIIMRVLRRTRERDPNMGDASWSVLEALGEGLGYRPGEYDSQRNAERRLAGTKSAIDVSAKRASKKQAPLPRTPATE